MRKAPPASPQSAYQALSVISLEAEGRSHVEKSFQRESEETGWHVDIAGDVFGTPRVGGVIQNPGGNGQFLGIEITAEPLGPGKHDVVDHIIREPREIYFAEEGRQFMGLDITDLEGAHHIVKLKDSLALPMNG